MIVVKHTNAQAIYRSPASFTEKPVTGWPVTGFVVDTAQCAFQQFSTPAGRSLLGGGEL